MPKFSVACVTVDALALCWCRMLDNNLLTDSLMSMAESFMLSKDGVPLVAGTVGEVLPLVGEDDCCCWNRT